MKRVILGPAIKEFISTYELISKILLVLLFCFFSIWLGGCGMNSAKKHYILAEKLWANGKYQAAVNEFDKVIKKDPKGKLGLQALFRSAMTQTVFLSRHMEAMEKFKTYSDLSGDTEVSWSAQRQIGEILSEKLKAHDQVIQHYQKMLDQHPKTVEAPAFLFKIGKAKFFLRQFGDAIEVYQRIVREYSDSLWAEKAAFEIGETYFTNGEQRPGGEGPGMSMYKKAVRAYEEFLQAYPNSDLVPRAKFGVAACYEELDQLGAASQKYEELLPIYPSQNVIRIKLYRIKERLTQKNQ